jgi:hypothetical protein
MQRRLVHKSNHAYWNELIAELRDDLLRQGGTRFPDAIREYDENFSNTSPMARNLISQAVIAIGEGSYSPAVWERVLHLMTVSSAAQHLFTRKNREAMQIMARRALHAKQRAEGAQRALLAKQRAEGASRVAAPVTAQPHIDAQVDDIVEVFIEPHWSLGQVIRRVGNQVTVRTQKGSASIERYFDLCQQFVRLPAPASTESGPVGSASVTPTGPIIVAKSGPSSQPKDTSAIAPSAVPLVAKQGPPCPPKGATVSRPSAVHVHVSESPLPALLPVKEISAPSVRSVPSDPGKVAVAAASTPIAGAQSVPVTRPTLGSLSSAVHVHVPAPPKDFSVTLPSAVQVSESPPPALLPVKEISAPSAPSVRSVPSDPGKVAVAAASIPVAGAQSVRVIRPTLGSLSSSFPSQGTHAAAPTLQTNLDLLVTMWRLDPTQHQLGDLPGAPAVSQQAVALAEPPPVGPDPRLAQLQVNYSAATDSPMSASCPHGANCKKMWTCQFSHPSLSSTTPSSTSLSESPASGAFGFFFWSRSGARGRGLSVSRSLSLCLCLVCL